MLAQQVTAGSAPGANTKPAMYQLASTHSALSFSTARVAHIENLAQNILALRQHQTLLHDRRQACALHVLRAQSEELQVLGISHAPSVEKDGRLQARMATGSAVSACLGVTVFNPAHQHAFYAPQEEQSMRRALGTRAMRASRDVRRAARQVKRLARHVMLAAGLMQKKCLLATVVWQGSMASRVRHSCGSHTARSAYRAKHSRDQARPVALFAPLAASVPHYLCLPISWHWGAASAAVVASARKWAAHAVMSAAVITVAPTQLYVPMKMWHALHVRWESTRTLQSPEFAIQ